MAQPLSIENKNYFYFITTRTAGSRLWLIGNKELENQILGYLGKYQQRYGVEIYGFILMGNHYHLIARFPRTNRAKFMRDFNSATARAIGRLVGVHGRRSVWERRYAHQAIVRLRDLHHWFYYLALNPVSSGLVKNVNDYNSYNSFEDSIQGKTRTYNWIDWSAYTMAVRWDTKLKPKDFVETCTLTFSKLPTRKGELSESQLRNELTERQQVLVEKRIKDGKGFLGKYKLYRQEPGATPFSTKRSTRYSKRPLILTLCYKTKQRFLTAYFSIRSEFSVASKRFLGGNLTINFPTGTYRPPFLSCYNV